jgi:hypothetical protein
VNALARYGVEFIYLPSPADPQLKGNLDSVSGLTPASAVHPGAGAWQLDTRPSGASLPAESGTLKIALLVVEGLALLTAAVLAAPTRKVAR